MADSKKNNRYRNPANDLIDAAVGGTKKAARAAGRTAKKSVKAAQTAAGRTVKRQEQQEQQGIGLRGRRKRQEEKTKATKPAPKPAAKPVKQGDYVSPFAGARDAYFNQAGRYQVPKDAKPAPKPAPKPAAKDAPKPAAPKPAGKVPSSTAGMKNQDKNFRGNPERKDSIASTLRELRGMGSGRKAAESKMSKPEDKSRYVAPDGRQYAGPAYGNGSKEQNGNSNSSTYTAQSDGAKKLQEAQKERAAKAKRDAEERAKKARERLAASASKKPGSTYG